MFPFSPCIALHQPISSPFSLWTAMLTCGYEGAKTGIVRLTEKDIAFCDVGKYWNHFYGDV